MHRYTLWQALIGGILTPRAMSCLSVGMGAKDSIAATLMFMVAAMVTVFIYNRVAL